MKSNISNMAGFVYIIQIIYVTVTLLTRVTAQRQAAFRQQPPLFHSAISPARFPNPANLIGQNPLGFGLNPFLNANPAFGGNNYMLNNGLSGGYQNSQFAPRQQEEIFTAIARDPLDPNSQMRLTIRERQNYNNWNNNPLFPDYDAPTSWYVQGTFLGSAVKNKAGTFQVVLTTGGRTADGCDGTTLGHVDTQVMDPQNPFGQVQYPNGFQTGILPNKLLIGASGPTMYASTLEGVSRRQLAGAGLAACQYVNNGVCSGYIPFCATVAKDNLPAMEVPMNNQQQSVAPFTNSLFSGSGGLGVASSLGLGGGGLAFTDPNAANSNPLGSQSAQTGAGGLF